MPSSIRLSLPAPASAVVSNIAALFARQVAERCGVPVRAEGPGDPAAGGEPAASDELALSLEIVPGIGAEGYRLTDLPDGGIAIQGQERGLLYGLGKLLRTSRYAPGEFVPGSWRGVAVPEKPVRGIYLATHFHNFYHDAPIAEVQRYVQELALWGTNVVSVWFDMHHYNGIGDPAAQAMIARLKAILRAASDLGIGASLTSLANEAYADSPVELRADWTAGHDGYHHAPGGHYHVELCPNKPGAQELLLRWAEERLEAFADINIEYLWIWPYDQGGCTCAQCKPWGINGFLTMAEPMARLYRQRFPRGKVVLSAWYFDHFTDGEWAGLDQAFATRPDWADVLLADDNADIFPPYPLQHGVPGGLPMVNFSEISMYRASPWGGFGANPFPQHLQALWDSSSRYLSGGFPYSEGIYEDINKAVCAQFYWQERVPALDAVREYIAYEFSPEVVEPVSRAIAILERNLPRSRQDDALGARFVLDRDEGAEEAWSLLEQADARLSAAARRSWRWRVLYLRALVDWELARNHYRVSERCEQAFRELTAIYHADQAAYWVAPPTGEAILANRSA